MYIALETIDVWEIDGDFEPCVFLNALPYICVPDDVLVVGSYDVEEGILGWLLENEIELPDGEKPFSDTFDLNRDEYPRGKSFILNPGEAQNKQLSAFCGVENGGRDRQLFFDHIAIYRPGVPLVPLLNFHDAFRGTLYLSGHYSAKRIGSFASALGATFKLMINPDSKKWESEWEGAKKDPKTALTYRHSLLAPSRSPSASLDVMNISH